MLYSVNNKLSIDMLVSSLEKLENDWNMFSDIDCFLFCFTSVLLAIRFPLRL